jgi:hypothetical protein
MAFCIFIIFLHEVLGVGNNSMVCLTPLSAIILLRAMEYSLLTDGRSDLFHRFPSELFDVLSFLKCCMDKPLLIGNNSHRNERFDRFCPLLITKNSSQPNDSGNGKQCSSKYIFELHVAVQQLKPKLSTMFPL